MKAYIRRDYAFNNYGVVFLVEGDGKRRILRWLDDAWILGELLEGAALERPSLVLQEDMLKALVDAALEILPADGSMASHLKDAMATRDRVFRLLEHERGMSD